MNQNLLAPHKFKIIVEKFPNTNFWTQRLNIPSVNMSTVPLPAPEFVDGYLAGDKLIYEDLTLGFLIDEDLEAFSEIHDWIVGAVQGKQVYSDITVIPLTNNGNAGKRKIVFYNACPYSLSTVLLDTVSSEDQPLTTDVTFKYTHYEFKPTIG